MEWIRVRHAASGGEAIVAATALGEMARAGWVPVDEAPGQPPADENEAAPSGDGSNGSPPGEAAGSEGKDA